MEYVSLRELREQLLYLRMTHPQDSSEWARVQLVATTVGGLVGRANWAIRDAICGNPTHIHGVLSSEGLGPTARAIPLPSRVSQVIRVNVQVGTELADGREIRHWRFEPQSQTPRLHVFDVCATSSPLNIHYAHVPTAPLDDLRAAGPVWAGISEAVYATGMPDPTCFPYPGFLELTTPFAFTASREVVRYETVTNTSFVSLTRGIEGRRFAWTGGANISYVVEMPTGYRNVVERYAQAALFEALLQDRTLYPQYAAAAGERATPAQELAALVGLLRSIGREQKRTVLQRPQTQKRGTTKRRI